MKRNASLAVPILPGYNQHHKMEAKDLRMATRKVEGDYSSTSPFQPMQETRTVNQSHISIEIRSERPNIPR